MRIGLFMLTNRDIPSLVERIVRAEEEGFDAVWFGQIMGPDVMTVLALAGTRTQRIELGTSVIPVQLRHPLFMAQQALAVNSAGGGRLTLGLGPSHRIVVEGMWGLSYDRAAAYMREYLSVLRPLLHERKVNFQGEFFRVNVELQVPDARPCPVLVSALGPIMLRLAGELSEGTVTWMTGPRALESYVVPRIVKAAEAAGRPRPRIAVGLPIAVSSDPQAARERAGRLFQLYNQLPSYRRMLDIEGASGPQDVAIVGSEEEVEAQLRRLASIGATDFLASVFPGGDGDDAQSMGRTREFLRSLVGKL